MSALDGLVGKTVASVSEEMVLTEMGDEPGAILTFTDGTTATFILAAEVADPDEGDDW